MNRMKADCGFLAGGGEMGALMRACDWAKTPLGPVEKWPQSLRSAVSILLPSRAQICLFWGPELVAIYNDPYRPTLGVKHPRALGLPAREVWSEFWEDVLQPLFEGVLKTGEAFWASDFPFFLERHGYPEETFFDVSYDPVRDESDAVGGVFCIVAETTGRVVGGRRLRTLRDLSARTSEAKSVEEVLRLAAGVLAENLHDIPFAFFYLHDAASGRLASAPGQDKAPPPDDWPIAEISRTGKPQVLEELGARFGALPGGPWPEPAQSAVALPITRAGQGAPYGFVAMGVSPRRRLDADYLSFLQLIANQIGSASANALAYEEERKRAEALAELDRAKTAFFSNVSHEFRTPLTLMLGPIEEGLADVEQPLQPIQRERQELVKRSSLRLQKLVNTLLDFSRIEAGRAQASYAPADLAALTADLASSFRSAVERAGLKLTVDCPPLAEAAYVDRDMWEKIVLNLLSNALKFTFEGGIAITLCRAGEHIELAVRDSGTGIAAGELPHVFDRFRRVEGARSRTHEGTGIGLALVQELVKLHGGSMRAESAPGEGSVFTVIIPAGRAHLPADRTSPASTQASTSLGVAPYLEEALGWLPDAEALPQPAQGQRERIVWADDNAGMRDYVRRLLAPRYEVEAVADGEAALAAVRRQRPDLVLADVMMPKLDGLDLLRALRADPETRTIPAILLSARTGEESRIEGLGAGADAYMHKPFSARELLARIASRLELGRLQARLQQERADLASLFAQTPVPTAVLRGPELVFEMANAAYLAVTGRGGIVGKPLLEALPELRGQGFDDLLRGVIRSGNPHIGRETPVKLVRDGRIEDTYFTFIYAPLRGASGEIDSVIAIVNEVTEQVRARKAIAESEARYRGIFQTAGVSIWEEDFSKVKAELDDLKAAGVRDLRRYFAEHPEFVQRAIGMVRVLDVNQATLHMFGAQDKTELVESLHKIFVPATEKAFIGELLAIAEGRTLFESDAAVRTLQDEAREVLLTIAFPPPGGSFERVLVTMMDITGRKRAEEALGEEARTLETLNRVGSTLAAELDLERTVQSVTDAATDLSGAQFGAFFYNVKNEAGESYLLYTLSGAPREAFAKFGTPRNTALFGPTFAGQGVMRLDDVTKDPRYGKSAPHHGMPKGHLPVRSYLAVPVVSRSGEVIGGLFFGHPQPGVFTERSERLVTGIASQAAVAMEKARLYQERTQLIEQLREADRRKDEFLAMLSHELRNPLAPIRNAVTLLKEAGGEAEIRKQAQGILERQVDHMIRLVDDLLDIARISRGSIGLRKQTVSLAAVIESAVETSRPLVEAGGHRLEVDLPQAPVAVSADPVRLAQVIANLINNAAKYTPHGGRIQLAVRAEPGAVEISVRDNGIGIEPEQLSRVFEMFGQIDSSRRQVPGGLGIGLALARQLVELHGGSIQAHSEGPGRGSEFTVRLPAAAPGELALPRTSEPPHKAYAAGRVLVVDDNIDAARSLGMLLEQMGHSVQLCHDGQAALAAARRHPPEIVLLDIDLPKLDGFAVAKLLRQDRRLDRVPIVAVTGYGQDVDRKRAQSAGFDEHLVKPVDPGVLRTTLELIQRKNEPARSAARDKG